MVHEFVNSHIYSMANKDRMADHPIKKFWMLLLVEYDMK